MRSDGGSSFSELSSRRREQNRNPILTKIQSGIYKAITTGEPDPEGRGRLSAYVPKLGGTPDTPMYFQYASPFGGSNGSSNYGFFAVPPDKGLTVMVFFAEGGDTTEGYWFSVLQQVPNVASGGTADSPQVDGTGQGEGAFADANSTGSVATLGQAQDPENSVYYDEFGNELPVQQGGTGQTTSTPVPTNIDPNQSSASNRQRLTTLTTRSGKSFQIATAYARNFEGFISDLESTGYNIRSIGGYRESAIAGSSTTSWHQSGVAIDINPDTNGVYYGPVNPNNTDMPNNIEQIASRHGLGWGGTWSGNKKDPMHFCMASNEGGSVSGLTRGVVPGSDPNNTQPTQGFGTGQVDPALAAASEAAGGNPIPNAPRNANLANQGTYTDPLRGQSSSSPSRDANYNEPGHSRVFGMSTPGQSAITFDDGSVDDQGTIHPSQIRLTTGSGAGIIIDGSNDMVYVVNSSGSSWVEVGADGNISVYGSGSISMRAEGDINFRADQNFNIEAGQRINMRSGSHLTAVSMGEMRMKAEGSQFFTTAGTNHTKVGSNMYVSTGGLMHLNGPAARQSPDILTASMPDIQNLESTQTPDVIGSSMPSHEPYLRPSPADTGGGGYVPDPSSYAAQASSIDAQMAAAYNGGENVSGQVVATGEGGGTVRYGSIGTRRLPLQPQLLDIITQAAQQCSLDIVITSAGQALRGTSGPRTGSTRHDLGYAADIAMYSGSRALSVARTDDLPYIITFCRTLKSLGAMSIGAGPGYMGSTAIHVDIAPGNNLTPASAGRYWGASHGASSAPSWLRQLMA